jgi:hypothetical protein
MPIIQTQALYKRGAMLVFLRIFVNRSLKTYYLIHLFGQGSKNEVKIRKNKN